MVKNRGILQPGTEKRSRTTTWKKSRTKFVPHEQQLNFIRQQMKQVSLEEVNAQSELLQTKDSENEARKVEEL